MTILLVEDDTRTELMVKYALEELEMEYQLVCVHDGDEAIDLLLNKPPLAPIRLVMLDLKLPKVDGTEVLKAIRERSETRFLPVVIFTSSEDPKDMERCYHLGINSYTVKPTGFEEFSETVKAIGCYWLKYNRVLG